MPPGGVPGRVNTSRYASQRGVPGRVKPLLYASQGGPRKGKTSLICLPEGPQGGINLPNMPPIRVQEGYISHICFPGGFQEGIPPLYASLVPWWVYLLYMPPIPPFVGVLLPSRPLHARTGDTTVPACTRVGLTDLHF